MTGMTPGAGPGYGYGGWTVNWSAILASVFCGLGFTFLLMAIGIATGISATQAADQSTLVGIGTWSVISALLGALLGAFIGGRFTRGQASGSSVYHALSAWGFMQVAMVLLGMLGAVGLLGAGLESTFFAVSNGTAYAGEAIGWSGWALVAGMALSLLTSVLGWWFGARGDMLAYENAAAPSHEMESSRRMSA